MKVIDKVLRIGEGKILRQLQGIAKMVNSIEDDFVGMTDEELRGQTAEFKQRHENGESLDALLPEAFAVVREAAKRTLHQRPYDVQVMGGAALHLGNIAEMKTGEGKTLVATLPSYLNALEGKGVHVVTVNDYLAEYQSELMGRVHRFLGLEVGVILAHMRPEERRQQYAADITWTSKCRCPRVRRAASRTVANASGRMSSRLCPSASRWRNSSVIARSSASVMPTKSSSIELTCPAMPVSLRRILPSPARSILSKKAGTRGTPR